MENFSVYKANKAQKVYWTLQKSQVKNENGLKLFSKMLGKSATKKAPMWPWFSKGNSNQNTILPKIIVIVEAV